MRLSLFSSNRVPLMRSPLAAIVICGCVAIGSAYAGSQGQAGSTPDKQSGAEQSQGNDNLHEQIDDLESQIQNLRQQSLELQEKTRLKLKAQIDYLQQQRDTLIPKVERLRDNSETAWQDIKENIQKAIEELKKSVDVIQPN